MANFSKLIITEQGKKLLQDSFLSREAILYTQIGVADHSYEEEELEALKELQHIRQIQAVRKIERENGDTVVLDTVFDNKNVQEGYFFRTIGLYAKSEGQEELLFAVAAERSNASYMPEHTGITTSIQVKLRVKLDNGETIHITVDPAGTATIGDVMDVRSWLETHIGDRDNPHHVTPEQLGVEPEANHYVHPAAHPADMVTQDENHRFVTDEQKQVWDGKMEKNGDSAENTAVYTSGDGTNPAGWTDVAVMASGEKHKTFLNKLSTMAKNVRWLYKMLGTTNIASIGGGTVTGAISALNTGLNSFTNNYLPLSGGTITGNAYFNAQIRSRNIVPEKDSTYELGSSNQKYNTVYSVNFVENGTALSGKYQEKGSYAAANHTHNYAPGDHTHSYLPLSGGTLSGHLVLNNSKAIQSKNSSGALCQLFVFNSSNNFHIGPYVESTQKPTIYLHGGGSEYEFTSTSFHPGISNTVTFGKSNKLWQAVYAKNGTIQTSDRTKKHNIQDIPDKYIDLFYKLKPKIYMFCDGDRIHVGAISQDVEEALQSLGMSAKEFGGFCKDIRYEYEYDEDGCEIESTKKPVIGSDGNPVYDYSMRYQEFDFMHIEATHRLKKEVEEIKQLLARQNERIQELEKENELLRGNNK